MLLDMSADAYLQAILNREAVDTGPYSPVWGAQAALHQFSSNGQVSTCRTSLQVGLLQKGLPTVAVRTSIYSFLLRKTRQAS